MNTQTYSVSGMTCAHCEAAVTSEVHEVPGVAGVTVDLVPGGTSEITVTSDQPVDDAAIAAAIDEAGYEVV